MQPHIIFPILIFAFGLGTFITTFVEDVSSESDMELPDRTLLTREEAMSIERNMAKIREETEREERHWMAEFQESMEKDYHYPVKEVSIHLPLYKPEKRKVYTLSTEYLEPYQNFCVNQVLNKVKNIRYKVIENGDRIKFNINSTSKKTVEDMIKEFEYYDIRAVVSK
jgi:hypothetical protein